MKFEKTARSIHAARAVHEPDKIASPIKTYFRALQIHLLLILFNFQSQGSLNDRRVC